MRCRLTCGEVDRDGQGDVDVAGEQVECDLCDRLDDLLVVPPVLDTSKESSHIAGRSRSEPVYQRWRA